MKRLAFYIILLNILGISFQSYSQELYTARGYWVETTKDTYRKVKQKENVGDTLTDNEISYLKDYETYLYNYFQRLPEAEKIRYAQMKDQWDRELARLPATQQTGQPVVRPEEFEWRARDRLVNTLYGVWYGTSLVLITEMEGGVAAGIPFITGGMWLMGPAVFPKKYEGITQSTVRASSTGKFLGLLYGFSLGTAIGGNNENVDKLLLGLSTAGSIALGEVGFQLQKKRNFSDGHIEMIRHYGVLGPWVGLSIFAATHSESYNLAGVSLLAGGVGGLIIGNQVSKRYAYTRGDVDAVQSLTWISTGLGLTLVAEGIADDETVVWLIPAASSIIGTVLGQKSVKGANFTKKQGSTISLSTAGAALIGLGFVALFETEYPSVWIGVPSAVALLTHQLLFHSYKRENLQNGFRGREKRKNNFQLSMNVMPENYFFNQKLPVREYNPSMNSQIGNNPIVKFKLTF
jgi:hypothetical protein